MNKEEIELLKNLNRLTEEQINLLKKQGEQEEKNNGTRNDTLNKEKETNKELKTRDGILKGLSNVLKGINEQGNHFVSTIGLTVDGFDSLFKSTVKINSELTKMSARLGEANRNGFKQVKEAFETATKEVGESIENANNTVKSLIDNGYIGNFKEATKAISLFSMATDVSRENVADTFNYLNKTMKIGENGIASIYASMQKISQTYGLTKKGIETVSTSIKKMTDNMKSFGSNENNIKQMAIGTAKLASQFEKVGLEASKAAALVDQLTDPDNIEKNIGLYAQLGMSISDALTGNFDENQMRAGLADFGNRLKEMGPIAGSAFAKTFNISYRDAMKYADMEQITEDAVTPEVKAMEELAKGLDKTQDAFSLFEKTLNKIKGMIVGMGPAVLGVLALVVPRIKKSIDDIINKIGKATGAIEDAGDFETTREMNKILINDEKKELQRLKKSLTQAYLGGNVDEIKNVKGKIIDSKNNITELKKQAKFSGNIFSSAYEQGIKKPIASVRAGFEAGGAGGALKSILGGAMKFLGPISLVLTLLAPILQKNQKFMDKISKVTEQVTNILNEALTPIIEEISKALFPLIDSLLPILIPIIKFLAKVLQIVLKPIVWIANGLGKLFGLISRIFGLTAENTEAIKDNTEEQKNSSEQIRADSSGRTVATRGNISNSATESQASTVYHNSQENNTVETRSSSIVNDINRGISENIMLVVEQLKQLRSIFTQENMVGVIKQGTEDLSFGSSNNKEVKVSTMNVEKLNSVLSI